MKRLVLAATLIGTVGLTACENRYPGEPEEPGTVTEEEEVRGEAAPAETMETSVKIETAEHDEYGKYLIDSSADPLFIFTGDEKGEIACTEDCAKQWPPALTDRPLIAGEGVLEDKLGKVNRDAIAKQVAYAGYPLYYHKPKKKKGKHQEKEKHPSALKHQGTKAFGGRFYLVSPDGTPIKVDASEKKPGGS